MQALDVGTATPRSALAPLRVNTMTGARDDTDARHRHGTTQPLCDAAAVAPQHSPVRSDDQGNAGSAGCRSSKTDVPTTEVHARVQGLRPVSAGQPPPMLPHTPTPLGTPAPTAAPSVNASAIAAHPPAAAKPLAQSRRSSMARLRQLVASQQQQQQQQQDPSDRDDPHAADRGTTSTVVDGEGGSTVKGEAMPLYSYRPALPTSSLPSSPTASAAIPVSADTHKVLPNGLRSPSPITDLDAMLLDDTGLSNDSSECAHLHSSTGLDAAATAVRPPHPVLRQPWAKSRDGEREDHEDAGDAGVPPLPRSDDGGALHTGTAASPGNAPFRALQFVPPSPTDPIVSPPLSNPDGPALDVPTRSPRGVLARQPTSASTVEAAAAPHAVSSLVDAPQVELPSLMVCPLALVGCCPSGTHRSSELYSALVQHEHLLAMAKCVQRMRGRQQELEQRVRGLQEQLSGQTAALRETQQALRRARWRSPACPSTADSTAVSAMEEDGDGDMERRPCGSKALPRDVSLHARHLTEFGLDDGDAAAAGHRTAGMYARQLRRRTATAAAAGAAAPSRQSSDTADTPNARASRAGQEAQPSSTVTGGASTSPTPSRSTRRVASAQSLRRQKAPQRAPLKRTATTAHNAATHARTSDTSAGGCGGVGAGDLSSLSADGGHRVTWGPAAARSSRADNHPKRLPAPPGAPSRLHGGTSSDAAGACGSTEVSGMSSVPPYQPPNASMSPISSASLDLDDHEDDTDDGAMRRQLLCLTPSGRPIRLALQAPVRADSGVAAVASARSAPSLVSVTYRPSELAHAQTAAAAGAGPLGVEPPPPSSSPAARVRLTASPAERPAPSTASSSVSLDGVRLAAPLQRHTVVRQSDAVPAAVPLPGRVTPSDVSAVVLLPRAVASPALSHAAAATSEVGATRGILDRSDAARPRRLSAPDSDGHRVPLSGICLGAPGTASPGGGPTAAVPLLGSVTPTHRGVAALQPTRHTRTHAHSHHADDGAEAKDGAAEGRGAEVEEGAARANVTAGPRVRRRSGSKSRRPAHATSLLSTQEAMQQGVAVQPLGLPPRRGL